MSPYFWSNIKRPITMSTSHFPPEYIQPCLFSIEQAVLATYEKYPQLRDKEVEETYEQLRGFFQKLAKSEELDEPSSTRTVRQALIEAILEALDTREALGADNHLIMNDSYQPGGYPIPCLETLYAMGFNYLRRSARFWRKERGPNGYLKFISEHLPG